MFKTNSEYQKKLLKRWAPILEKGAAIDSVEKKLVLAQVLENTRKEFTKKNLFTEAAPSNTNNLDARHPTYTAPIAGQGVLTANDYILPNVVMPMLRRIFPTLMAHELVGVQAMTGPTGLVMALRAVAANPERVGLPQGYEFGYGNRGRANQSVFTGDKAANTNIDVGSDESKLMNKLYRNDNTLDNVFEFLMMSGLSLPQAMAKVSPAVRLMLMAILSTSPTRELTTSLMTTDQVLVDMPRAMLLVRTHTLTQPSATGGTTHILRPPSSSRSVWLPLRPASWVPSGRLKTLRTWRQCRALTLRRR